MIVICRNKRHWHRRHNISARWFIMMAETPVKKHLSLWSLVAVLEVTSRPWEIHLHISSPEARISTGKSRLGIV